MQSIEFIQNLGTMLVLASSSSNICATAKTAEISVVPASKKITLYTDKSLAQMQSVQTDTIDPHSFGGISVMQGFAKASIKMSAQALLDYKYDPRSGTACVWYDKVTIKFDIDPSIHIAKEVYADRCMRKAVYGHEMKHVMTDRKIVNKYSNIIGKKLYSELKSRGFISGAVRPENVQAVADRMKLTVSQIIEHEYKRLELDRAEWQRAVDSKEEYDRVSKLCPKFKVTDEMLYGSSNQSYGRSSTYGR